MADLCDCKTSNFAKVRLKLYCWLLPSLNYHLTGARQQITKEQRRKYNFPPRHDGEIWGGGRGEQGHASVGTTAFDRFELKIEVIIYMTISPTACPLPASIDIKLPCTCTSNEASVSVGSMICVERSGSGREEGGRTRRAHTANTTLTW